MHLVAKTSLVRRLTLQSSSGCLFSRSRRRPTATPSSCANKGRLLQIIRENRMATSLAFPFEVIAAGHAGEDKRSHTLASATRIGILHVDRASVLSVKMLGVRVHSPHARSAVLDSHLHTLGLAGDSGSNLATGLAAAGIPVGCARDCSRRLVNS